MSAIEIAGTRLVQFAGDGLARMADVLETAAGVMPRHGDTPGDIRTFKLVCGCNYQRIAEAAAELRRRVEDAMGAQGYWDTAAARIEEIFRQACPDADPGATLADLYAAGETGDGVGILLQVSHSFFSKAAAACGIDVGGPGDYGVGMFFFPQDAAERDRAKAAFETVVRGEGLQCLGWRDVPTNPDTLGQRARSTMPHIAQCFIARPDGVEKGLHFDRRLYIARRLFEKSREGASTYVVSMSSRTVVYKGMFLVRQLRDFYHDLQSEDYQSALALARYCGHCPQMTLCPDWEPQGRGGK